MVKFKTDDTRDLIMQMDKNELRQVQKYIVKRWGQLTENELDHFAVGDRVEFKSKTGTTITGHVVKLNRKSVAVQVISPTRVVGATWLVAPSLLERVV